MERNARMRNAVMVAIALTLGAVGGYAVGSSVRKDAVNDVLALSARSHFDPKDEYAMHLNYWRHQEHGVWVQVGQDDGPLPMGCVRTAEDACIEFLKKWDPDGQYHMTSITHHARLWVLRYVAHHEPDTALMGGVEDLWYDAQLGKVVAMTMWT